MTIQDMIAVENSDSRRDAWQGFRKEMTSHILETVISFYCKQQLRAHGGIRVLFPHIDDYFNDIYKQLGRRPTVAIWGAGRCNDIDIVALAKYVDLVLIDRQMDLLKKAREKAGLDSDVCHLMDLKFWDIYDEDEEDFEKLFQETSPKKEEELQKLLKEIGDCAASFETSNDTNFDFSVALGLSSQLNARFAAILQLHQNNPFEYQSIVPSIRELNQRATLRLLQQLCARTKGSIICGNELLSGTPDDFERFSHMAEKMTQDAEEALSNRSLHFTQENAIACEIEGCKQFLNHLQTFFSNEVIQCTHAFGTIWNFSAEKIYLMEILTIENI